MSNKVKAEEEKNKGNECMKSQNPTEAVLHYTTGIKLDGKDHRLFSNRCLAFLQIQQYYLALQDAKTVIKLNPDWPKGYYRKGEVEYCTEHYEDAIKSYEAGLALESENEGILQAINKSKKKLEELTASERRLPWISAALGMLVGTVIVLADHLAADNPMLQSMVLRTVFVVVFISLGLLGSWLYKYMLQLQRSSLLEPLPDLGFGSTDSSSNSTQNSKKITETKRNKRKSTKT
ncbi:hsp70-Hsp90 organizing protein-like isoform X2 [Anneissia japonica]|uniref:hsp70-Hsp90 organizing protein-like isoform X2 n=1 Tax=Anneissia japonica TaxID=1529436 RepID=UPI0014259C16|nr:hsp70-Hsp90 organizing protein-like isoform X2 [Anneissia japonica]